MITRRLLPALLLITAAFTLHAQADDVRYIEVTGTAETEIVPDRIHYIIEIREYFEEEFDGKSKPEDYRTKVPIEKIEQELRAALSTAGISRHDIRTQEVGDFWRERGQDFLISKQFDVTLLNFNQIDKIIKAIDTKGIKSMHIGNLENDDILEYHMKGKTEALKAAERKAAYLVESLGKKLGNVIRIVENPGTGPQMRAAQSNVFSSDAYSYDGFRTIKNTYSILVRFEITDK